MKRGEMYWAVLAPRSGSEQQGRRPVIVVSHDGFNQTAAWRSVIVVPISSSGKHANREPTVVSLPKNTGGLKKPSAALCHQVTTLDRAKLTRRIGSLTPSFMEHLEAGLKAALNLT